MWRARAADRMAHAANESCFLITVALARSAKVDAVREVARQLRVELRNLRDRNARSNHAWRSVEIIGQVEVDAIGPDDIRFLPPRRRSVIEALPLFGGFSGDAAGDQIAVWISHVHLVVHAPSLSQRDLCVAFRRQWPGPVERVDVRPFAEGNAGDNAGRIIGYATKHEMRVKLKDNFHLVWPIAVETAYWGWLHSLHNGLAPLRIGIGKIKDVAG
jgi:hypothetical protein